VKEGIGGSANVSAASGRVGRFQMGNPGLISRRRDLRGKLTVTAPVEFGRRYVAPFLTGFLTRHRGLTADLLLLNRMVNLVEEGVDVAVRIARLKDSTLVAVPVGQVRRIVCASPRYLERHGTPQVPSDLKDHRCVRHTVLTPRSEWSFRVGQRDVMIPVDTVFASNDIGSVLDACMDGLGSGMFLSYMIGLWIRPGGSAPTCRAAYTRIAFTAA
jgi:DNA-binding transcriptional LysR family regulator